MLIPGSLQLIHLFCRWRQLIILDADVEFRGLRNEKDGEELEEAFLLPLEMAHFDEVRIITKIDVRPEERLTNHWQHQKFLLQV